ncbi:MAG: DUF2807 domain-containing protein [Bacteroidia bacterium]|nr:DUF2807 domain-containing protein [Bacteroidia bacterium]
MKTKLLSAFLTLSISASTLAHAETAEMLNDDRTMGNFYGLIVNTPANVILNQGSDNQVSVEGDRNLISHVSTSIRNGALVIDGNNNRPVTIYVTMEDINLIEINGDAKVYSSQLINSDFLLLKVNGSGSIKLDVRSLSLGMIVKGDGKIIASGSTDNSFVRVFGKGRVFAQNLDSFRYSEQVNSTKAAYRKDDVSGARRLTLKLHE